MTFHTCAGLRAWAAKKLKSFKFSCRQRQVGGSVGKYDYRLFHAWFRLRTANSRQIPIYIQIRFSLPHFFGRWECVDASNWRVDLTSFLTTLVDDKLSYKPEWVFFENGHELKNSSAICSLCVKFQVALIKFKVKTSPQKVDRNFHARLLSIAYFRELSIWSIKNGALLL